MSATTTTSTKKILLPRLGNLDTSKSDVTLDSIEKKIHQTNIDEYENDFQTSLFELESQLENTKIPEPLQSEILENRFNVVKSIYDVVQSLGWSYATFSLTVTMIDKYTSLVEIDPSKYKMVGRCCLWTASKYHENKPNKELTKALLKPYCFDMEHKREFLDLEVSILKALKWDLSVPTCDSFVDLFNTTNDHDLKFGSLFLCELALFNKEIFFNYSSSSIAAAAITLSGMVSNDTDSDPVMKIDELETLMLQAVIKLRLVYCNKDKYEDHLSNSTSIIFKLIKFANEEQQQQQQQQYYHQQSQLQLAPNQQEKLPQQQSPTQESIQPIFSSPGSDVVFPLSPATSPTYRPFAHHRHSSSLSALRGLHIDTSKAMCLPTPIITPGMTPNNINKPSPSLLTGSIPPYINCNFNSTYITLTPTSTIGSKSSPNFGPIPPYLNYGFTGSHYTPSQFTNQMPCYQPNVANMNNYVSELPSLGPSVAERVVKRRRFN